MPVSSEDTSLPMKSPHHPSYTEAGESKPPTEVMVGAPVGRKMWAFFKQRSPFIAMMRVLLLMLLLLLVCVLPYTQKKRGNGSASLLPSAPVGRLMVYSSPPKRQNLPIFGIWARNWDIHEENSPLFHSYPCSFHLIDSPKQTC